MPADQAHLAAGTELDRYVVEAILGEGGMGRVYRVRHRVLGSVHALKMLRGDSMRLAPRLLQEGRVQARLQHPNIVRVTDIVRFDGGSALVMEFVDGPTLEAWRATTSPEFAVITELMNGILAGVGHAHAEGVIHRDLKPANILLARKGERLVPRVTDFGLARLMLEAHPSLSRDGAVLGTPRYMAPEQIRGAPDIDSRADVFSLGSVLYELAVGQPAFPDELQVQIFQAILAGRYIPPRQLRPDLPEGISNAIEGALAVDRDARIPDCATFVAVLTEAKPRWNPRPEAPPSIDSTLDVPAPPPEPRRRLAPVVAAFGAMLVGVVGWSAWSQHRAAVLLEATTLASEARGQATTDPAAAIALARAANVVAGDANVPPLIPASEVEALIARGGANRVIPLPEAGIAVAASADARFIATPTAGQDVVVFDVATGETVFSAHEEHRRDNVRWSPTEPVLATWSTLGNATRPVPARSWRLPEGSVALTFGATQMVSAVKWSSDGRRILTGSPGAIDVWEARSGAHLFAHPDRGDAVFGPGGILTRSTDGTLLVIDETGASTPVAPAADDGVVGWDPLDRWVATGSDTRVLLLHRPDWTELASLPERCERGIVVAPTGDRILCVAASGNATLIDPNRARLVGRLADGPAHVEEAVFSPDGLRLATVIRGDTVQVVDAATGRKIRELVGHAGRVFGLGTVGNLLATVSHDRTLRLWSMAWGDNRTRLRLPGTGVTSRRLAGEVVASISDGVLQRDEPVSQVIDSGFGPRASLDVSADRICVAERHDRLTWHGPDGGHWTVIPPLVQPGGPGTCALVHSGVLVWNKAGVALLAEADGTPVWTVEAQDGGVVRAGVSADGAWLVLGTLTPGAVRVYELATRTLVAERKLAKGVSSLAWSPDGNSVVAATWDGVVLRWDSARPRELVEVGVHDAEVPRVTWSPDGSRYATGSTDKTARVWDAETNKVVFTEAVGEEVDTVALSADGLLAVAAAEHLFVRSLVTGSVVATASHEDGFRQLGFGDGVIRAVTGHYDLVDVALDAGDNGGGRAGALTNLRVCRDNHRVVPVVPFPDVSTVWAPEASCGD